MYLLLQGFRRRDVIPCLNAFFILCVFSIALAGCNNSKPAATAGIAPVKNVNSSGLAKLSATEMERKIQTVQADKSIPESAKPNIIQSIRAQGAP